MQLSLPPIRVSQRSTNGLIDTVLQLSGLTRKRHWQNKTEKIETPCAFVFDMDGAVVDCRSHHLQAWKILFAELGIKISAEELEAKAYGVNVEIIQRVAGNQISIRQLIEWCERKDALFRDIIGSNLRLVDGAHKFLDDARVRNIPMALITTVNQSTADFILDKLFLRSYYSAVVSGDDTDRGRPHPDSLLKACLRLGLMPEECIAIEYSKTGVEAAQRAGMKGLLVYDHPQSYSSWMLPNIIQTTPESIKFQ